MGITNSYEYQKLRGLKRKVHLIQLKGGCCEKCGYNKNIAAFDFHHKDPNKKDFNLDVRKLSNTKMTILMEEVEKCDLLCANCHREIHNPDLEIGDVKEKIKSINESVIQKKEYGKPKCIDCFTEINYTHIRCRKCAYISKRKVKRPDMEILINELLENTQEWCSEKYGVSRTTIIRWVKSHNKKNSTI
jgi:hypothetical protein